MTDTTNMTPWIYAEGLFTAKSPFNTVVDPTVAYKVEAVRTINEIQLAGRDVYELALKPVGISKDNATDYIDAMIHDNACIVTLTRRQGPTVYVPTTYLTSYPMVDGVVFERLCLIVDCGSCSPDTKNRLDDTLQGVRLVVQKNLGISSPQIQVGTLPERSYVSKTQAEAWENSRLLQIDSLSNPVIENDLLRQQISEYQTYIATLEDAIKKK